MGAVIVASTITTYAYGRFNPGDPRSRSEAVFRESIKRFAFIAAPIAAGYGIPQIISELADLFGRVPSM